MEIFKYHLKLLQIFTLMAVLLLLLFKSQGYAIEKYAVSFNGINECEIIKLFQKTSQTYLLQSSTSTTSLGLKRRAERDVAKLQLILKNRAYYASQVNVNIDWQANPIRVNFDIILGEIYVFKEFIIENVKTELDNDKGFILKCITPCELDIAIGMAAFPKAILNAEKVLIKKLDEYGYPLAAIHDKEVIADVKEKSIKVILKVDPGEKAYFGNVFIKGNHCVAESFIRKKIEWHKGAPYHPCYIEKTQAALDASNVFSSIIITHAEQVDEDGSLPIYVNVVEGEMKTVGAGFGFSTMRGFGIANEWENRNMRCRGEKLSFRTTLWQNAQEGSLYYLFPDIGCRGQDLIFLIRGDHEKTLGYHEISLTTSAKIERKLDDKTRVSYGLEFTKLRNTKSVDNGEFFLIKTPFYYRWYGTDNLLNPTCGHTLLTSLIPSFQVRGKTFGYVTTTMTATSYLKLLPEDKMLLAGKLMLGSILGSARRLIPPSERFYAGSETTLRGYHYLTVSPIDCRHDPVGGKSLMIVSIELRMRHTKDFGSVIFYDIGNVYRSPTPQLFDKQLQDVGIGLRYFTPIGPIRLDVAFPLNRRSHIDHRAFQGYLSIGQTY